MVKWFIIFVIVLVIMITMVSLFTDKGGALLDSVKRILRFGR